MKVYDFHISGRNIEIFRQVCHVSKNVLRTKYFGLLKRHLILEIMIEGGRVSVSRYLANPLF
jgi:hypothetical protein